MDTAWALGSYRISQHLSTLGPLQLVSLLLPYFLVSLPYFCCSFLSGSFVIFFFIFFFLSRCVAGLFSLPPKSSLWHQAASHFRPRRWCKGTGLLPGKVLGEPRAAAQTHPAPSSLGSPVPLPVSTHPTLSRTPTVLPTRCDPGLPPLCCRIELTSDLTSL